MSLSLSLLLEAHGVRDRTQSVQRPTLQWLLGCVWMSQSCSWIKGRQSRTWRWTDGRTEGHQTVLIAYQWHHRPTATEPNCHEDNVIYPLRRQRCKRQCLDVARQDVTVTSMPCFSSCCLFRSRWQLAIVTWGITWSDSIKSARSLSASSSCGKM